MSTVEMEPIGIRPQLVEKLHRWFCGHYNPFGRTYGELCCDQDPFEALRDAFPEANEDEVYEIIMRIFGS